MTLRARYAFVGALLSIGSPLGLLAVRAAGRQYRPRDIWRELTAHASTYAYITVSTALALATFGARVGDTAEKLAELSQLDPLTGLGNRRYFQQQLDFWIEHGKRHHTSIALLMIDVDGLKRVNDERGHAAGDAALVHVATSIRTTLRHSDIAGRIGGDEFGILAPFTDLTEGLILAERLVAAVRNGNGTHHADESISVGVAAVVPEPATEGHLAYESLFSAADGALYRAKQAGRARAVGA